MVSDETTKKLTAEYLKILVSFCKIALLSLSTFFKFPTEYMQIQHFYSSLSIQVQVQHAAQIENTTLRSIWAAKWKELSRTFICTVSVVCTLLLSDGTVGIIAWFHRNEIVIKICE